VTLGLPPSSVTFHPSNVCLIPFVMMRNKDNNYNLNLSSSVGGPS
jgi:hypothetical protein